MLYLGVGSRVVQLVTSGMGAWCTDSCTPKSDKPLVVGGAAMTSLDVIFWGPAPEHVANDFVI